MGFKVFLSGAALSDLEAIVAYIASDNPLASERFGAMLLGEAMSLEAFYERGRIVPEFSDPDLREIVFRSYRIVYRIQRTPREIEILRYWHAARGGPEIDLENEA